MNIIFKGKHKSIREFEWKDIPKLAVVTGLNGSGKSQLLEIIHSGYSHVSSDQNSNGVYKSTEFEMTLEGISFQRKVCLIGNHVEDIFNLSTITLATATLKKLLIL